jgi:hypothetical protein
MGNAWQLIGKEACTLWVDLVDQVVHFSSALLRDVTKSNP